MSHREYTPGFYFGKPDGNQQLYTSNTYIQDYTIVGVVKAYKDGIATVMQKNRFFRGDELEVIRPDGDDFTFTVEDMKNEDGKSIDVAPHAQMTVYMPMPKAGEYSIIRKKVGEMQ